MPLPVADEVDALAALHRQRGYVAIRMHPKRTNTPERKMVARRRWFYSRFFWISPADAAALSLALRALTAGKAFSGVAKSSVHEPTRASVRPARAIFLYSEGQSWPALSTTIPLCCNYCRSIARLPVRVFPEVYSLYCDSVTHAAELFWVF